MNVTSQPVAKTVGCQKNRNSDTRRIWQHSAEITALTSLETKGKGGPDFVTCRCHQEGH